MQPRQGYAEFDTKWLIRETTNKSEFDLHFIPASLVKGLLCRVLAVYTYCIRSRVVASSADVTSRIHLVVPVISMLI